MDLSTSLAVKNVGGCSLTGMTLTVTRVITRDEPSDIMTVKM